MDTSTVEDISTIKEDACKRKLEDMQRNDPTNCTESDKVVSQRGYALIKQEYVLVPSKETEKKADDQSETLVRKEQISEPPSKKHKSRGRNKNRPIDTRLPMSERICTSIIRDMKCSYGDGCKLCHDVPKFIANKPPDIADKCHNFDTFGRCSQGVACRYGSSHIDSDFKNIVNKELFEKMSKIPSVVNTLDRDVHNLVRKRKYDFKKADKIVAKVTELYENRKNQNLTNVPKVVDTKSDAITSCDSVSTSKSMDSGSTSNPMDSVSTSIPEDSVSTSIPVDSVSTLKTMDSVLTLKTMDSVSTSNPMDSVSISKTMSDCTSPSKTMGPVEPMDSISLLDKSTSRHSIDNKLASTPYVREILSDDELIRLRPSEKKKIDFAGKLFLAPLTTVGNLPFRRICKRYGADITCGEMALATNLLQGKVSEWALVKRHHTEDIFGVQLCGGYPDTMTRCAQLLNQELNIDFIDINCGCPIDMIYKKGLGSALIGKSNKLEQIVTSMSSVLDIPLTLKLRTGIQSDKNIAHTLIPKLRDWGISNITLHGRSREQRYTRSADWDYIEYCAQQAAPVTLFGNGDVFSYEEYYKHLDNTSISGIMIARGALIKPWIFTEIKERRLWDISATERLDFLKDFVNYGLEQWGSDQQGVDNCRRFLLEQLSFSYRYIPVGLLERPPQQINERPPRYQGRSDLETLLSSPNCADWVKISEMLLGPVRDNFSFLPKHKANSYQ